MSCVNKLERQAGQLLLVTCQVLLRTACGEIHPEMRFVTFCSCVLRKPGKHFGAAVDDILCYVLRYCVGKLSRHRMITHMLHLLCLSSAGCVCDSEPSKRPIRCNVLRCNVVFVERQDVFLARVLCQASDHRGCRHNNCSNFSQGRHTEHTFI